MQYGHDFDHRGESRSRVNFLWPLVLETSLLHGLHDQTRTVLKASRRRSMKKWSDGVSQSSSIEPIPDGPSRPDAIAALTEQ